MALSNKKLKGSREMARVAGRWLAIWVAIGLCLGVGIQKLSAFNSLEGEKALVRQSQSKSESLDEKVATAETVLLRLKHAGAIAEQKKYLASLYERVGLKAAQDGSLSRAEFCFQEASTFDPSNPNYRKDIADLYSDAATRETAAATRIKLLESAADSYEAALQREDARNEQAACRDCVASARLEIARTLDKMGKLSEARNELNRAQQYVSPNSQLAQEIASTLATLH